MKIRLEVVHTIPGRARIKIHSSYEPGVFFLVIEAALKEIEEILRAELNPHAASLTIYYGREANLDRILENVRNILHDTVNDRSFQEQMARIEESLRISNRGNVEVTLRDKIVSITSGMDQAVRRATRNNIDLKTALPAGAFTAGLATLFLAPGLPTPTWLVLFIFSISSFAQTTNAHSRKALPVDAGEVLRLASGRDDAWPSHEKVPGQPGD